MSNIIEEIERDPAYNQAMQVYKDMELRANKEAEKLSEELIANVVRKEDTFNISTALMTVAKAFTHLASYLYDTEEDFVADIQKARKSVVSDVIPTLLNPQPCGKCDNCKNGNPYECINPNVRGDYTTTRFLPLLCNMLIEYDMFNKIMHMHVVKDKEDAATIDNGNSKPKP